MIGSFVLRQHVVEFIRGVGIIKNGVVDNSSLNGPWSWNTPEDVARLTIDGTAPGGGGGGGQNTSTQRGGGSGASSGMCILHGEYAVLPGAVLTITLGSPGVAGVAGAPGAVASRGTKGGDTIIDGLLPRNPGFTFSFPTTEYDVNPGRLRLLGGNNGSNGGNPGDSSAGGSVGAGGSPNRLGSIGSGSNGVPTAASPSTPGVPGETMLWSPFGLLCQQGGGGGGAASTSPTTIGGQGAALTLTGGRVFGSYRDFQNLHGPGHQDGTNSYGGGGQGGANAFGYPGRPGYSTVPNASNDQARGFGFGGSGGRGDGDGSDGGEGYVRFTFWSARV